MKIKIDFEILSVLLLLSLFISPAISFAANPSISTSETVANVAAGTDDQTDTTSATTANVVEVKATRTITVTAVPAVPITLTIGTCVITIANAPASDTDCANNTAAIATSTDTTTSAIASRIRTITNLSDAGHGALTIGGSGATASFTTTSTETSATVITASLSAGTDFTLTTVNTAGVIPVVQVNTITIAGTVDTGDVFTATLPTVGAVTYTVLSSDTTTANIATGLNAAIQASSGYAGQAFTSTASTNTVILTAKVAGTGFTQTSSATNRSAVAQTVVFTPLNLVSGWTYTITINGTNYNYTQTSNDLTQNVVEALQVLVDGNSAVSCTENDTAITCTASSAGTTFTYATSVTNPPRVGGTSAGNRVRNLIEMGNCKLAQEVMNQYSDQTVGQQQYYQQKCLNTSVKQLGTVPSIVSVVSIRRNLQRGARGDDVSQMQRWFAQDKSIYPEGLVTGYFGPLTLSAVQKFQVKYFIVSEGEPGYGLMGPKTRAKLQEVFGN